jgi:hypothetical protein
MYIFRKCRPYCIRERNEKIENSNKGLVIRLNNILEKHIQEGENRAFVRLMINPSKDYSAIESVVNALKEMKKGFNNSI